MGGGDEEKENERETVGERERERGCVREREFRILLII